MGRAWRDSESGQAMSEYALVVAAIAVGCVFAVLVYLAVVNGLLGSTAEPLRPAPFVPPATTSELVYPTSADECLDGGWQDFPQFPDEQACLDYVASLTP